ncbi:ABC transporter substrate-binding protein [Roseibium sp.]|uniref:ABC transporter substrate-binding protein n=1 Tax=Roseibium sp. TaxID=1936156 RepID=UPI003B50CC86
MTNTKRALTSPGQSFGVSRRALLGGLSAALLSQPLSHSDAETLPLVFNHAYGTSVLNGPARRVISLGYTTQDPLLALGVIPLAIRDWIGAYPYGVWPWAQTFLGDAKPELLIGEVSMERVAALEPDLIIAIGSGISKSEYRILSHIAPVLMHDLEDTTYGTPWDKVTKLIGRATGKGREAELLVSTVRMKFSAAREKHLNWADRTAVAGYHWGGETGAFTGADTRATFLKELGFRSTDALIELSDPSDFYVRLSPEDLWPLDADVLVWISNFGDAPDLVTLPMRKTLAAHLDGREVFAGPVVAAAMSFGSVLSFPYVLEQLVEDIAAAIDGDAETIVESAQNAGLAP